MGRWHAAAIVRAGHVVAAVVDPDTSRAAALASSYRGAISAATLGSVGDADVVHVCTPLATHVPIAHEALTRGCHVVIEKPIAETLSNTRDIVVLAQASGRLIVPVHQFLFQDGVQEAARALPELGPLLHVDFVACTAGAAHLSESGQDGLIREILPHPLSLIARLVSPALTGAGWQVQHSRPGELRVHAALGDVTISLLISAGGRPTVNALRLIAARGTIHLDLFHGFAVVMRGRATRTGKVLQPFAASGSTFRAAATNLARRAATREPAYPGLRELIRRFYTAVQSGGPAPISPDECLAVAMAMETISERFER